MFAPVEARLPEPVASVDALGEGDPPAAASTVEPVEGVGVAAGPDGTPVEAEAEPEGVTEAVALGDTVAAGDVAAGDVEPDGAGVDGLGLGRS